MSCKITDMKPSYIPNIFILDLYCDKGSIRMDLHKSVTIVQKGDEVKITISKTLPTYEEGKDFLAKGFVITKREAENERFKILISLWGFLVVIETSDQEIVNNFNYMDEIFFLMKKT